MWNSEKQKLLEARTRSLKNAEKKVEELSQRNLVLETNYMKSTQNNTAMRNLISKIIGLTQSNTYNNDNARLGKIKELVTDYQSNN